VLTVGAALAACGTGSSTAGTAAGTVSSSVTAPSSSAPAVTTSAAPTTSTPAPTAPAPSTTTKKPAATPAAAPVTLVLEPDGLGYVAGAASVKHLPFGTDATSVRNLVEKALGGKLTSNDLPECGQGPRSSAGRAGFSVLLDGKTFVGWTDQGAKGRRLTTLDGLGIGSTYAQVQKALPGATASDGSLGAEFTDPGGLGGILAGMSPTSKVTLVYAGETCFFR
jgi:hypothetical protein